MGGTAVCTDTKTVGYTAANLHTLSPDELPLLQSLVSTLNRGLLVLALLGKLLG